MSSRAQPYGAGAGRGDPVVKRWCPEIAWPSPSFGNWSWTRNDGFSSFMLIGQYHHALDEKKRLAIPAKLRLEVGKRVAVTRGLDKCLFIYPMPIWERIAEKLGELPVGKSETRQFLRVLLSGATEAELDNLGRILVPDFLKTYAGLEKEVVIVGVYNRLEIWDVNEWNRYREEAEKNQDAIAEKLGEVGVY